jgi:hypothetical protein
VVEQDAIAGEAEDIVDPVALDAIEGQEAFDPIPGRGAASRPRRAMASGLA